MNKTRKLTLHKETLRRLDPTELGFAIGGAVPFPTIIVKVPTDGGSIFCSDRSVCGCPTNACSAGTQCGTCDGVTTC